MDLRGQAALQTPGRTDRGPGSPGHGVGRGKLLALSGLPRGSHVPLCTDLSFFSPAYSRTGLRAGGRPAFVRLGRPPAGSSSPHVSPLQPLQQTGAGW